MYSIRKKEKSPSPGKRGNNIQNLLGKTAHFFFHKRDTTRFLVSGKHLYHVLGLNEYGLEKLQFPIQYIFLGTGNYRKKYTGTYPNFAISLRTKTPNSTL